MLPAAPFRLQMGVSCAALQLDDLASTILIGARGRALFFSMCALLGIVVMHAARESCVQARFGHALHAHLSCSPCAITRESQMGADRTSLDFGMRCLAVDNTLQANCRPPAA